MRIPLGKEDRQTGRMVRMAKKTERVQRTGASQGLGRTGERLAGEHLIRCGYRVLERNFRCRYGEIDLVAEDEQDLIFVEVKTRRGDAYGRPEEAVTRRKQRKIIQDRKSTRLNSSHVKI